MRKIFYLFINLWLCILMSVSVVWAGEIHSTERDSDGDGISDIDEARKYGTDSQLADTDTDGLADGLEVNQYWTLPLVEDTDGDGFLDGVEVRLGTDPTSPMSYPTSKTPNFDDLDGDGLSNKDEKSYGTNEQKIDTDFDGLNDYLEIIEYFTNPLAVDTDGDGFWDGEEVKAGSDPGDADSTPENVEKAP